MEFSCEHCGMAELECAERSCDFCRDGMCMRCTIEHDDKDRCPNEPAPEPPPYKIGPSLAQSAIVDIPKDRATWRPSSTDVGNLMDHERARTEDGRPDFAGFAAALRAEARGTGVIHRNDRTGQADHDQRVLLELAERVEAVGDRMGYCGKTEPKPADGYPEGWPRCPGCGRAALDGHITCGDARCGEGARRRKGQQGDQT